MAYLFSGNLCFSSDERCVTVQLGDRAIITWRGAGLVGKLVSLKQTFAGTKALMR